MKKGKMMNTEHHQKAWSIREATVRGELLNRYTGALKILTAAIAAAAVTACSSVNVEEMDQLDGNQARTLISGSTMTFKADYGRWAEYFSEGDLSGAGQAWGDWGKERADATASVAENGEVCNVYTGDHEWSKPEFNYCFVVFQDAESNYVIQTTQNNNKPERIGDIKKVAFIGGDKYGLMN